MSLAGVIAEIANRTEMIEIEGLNEGKIEIKDIYFFKCTDPKDPP